METIENNAWQPVDATCCYGIAIYNYHNNDNNQHHLQLFVGDAVHVARQYNNDWYYGNKINNNNNQNNQRNYSNTSSNNSNEQKKKTFGIFPKCFIHIIANNNSDGNDQKYSDKRKSGDSGHSNKSLVGEITAVVREWGSLAKQLYLTTHPDFKRILVHIYELIQFRSRILSETLPLDELKELKKLTVLRINIGNKLLGLDLVVRDEQLNLLNPERSSTIQIYAKHKEAEEIIKKTESGDQPCKPFFQQFSHIFFVSLRNFVCKMYQDAQLLLTLYDATEFKAISESYVVRWAKEGLTSDIDLLHNLRVLFTDLGTSDLQRAKVYIVCQAVRIGGGVMETSKEAESRRSLVSMPIGHSIGGGGASIANKRSSMSGSTNGGIRRPFGVAAMDITRFLNGSLETDDELHHFIPFQHCYDKDNLDSTLRKIITASAQHQLKHNPSAPSAPNPNSTLDHHHNLSKDTKFGLWISMKLLPGDLKQVRDENPHLVLGNVVVARKMGFPEVILPGDVRNDLYLTLVGGEFGKRGRGSKTTSAIAKERNIEVVVTCCDQKGQAVPGVIHLGAGSSTPLNAYHSVVYYHEDRPKWQEIIKIALPIEEFKNCHLKFTFKHRSSNEAKDKSEKPFGFAFVQLMQSDGTTLRDEQHELCVYRMDHRKYVEGGGLDYLELESHKSQTGVGVKQLPAGLSCSSRDVFSIASNICSTKLTQNVDLLGLLNWTSASPDRIQASLQALLKVGGEEVVKFLQDVLDALFSILMQTDAFDSCVFDCLLHVIGLVSDRKYQHFQPVLDLYIKETFSATLAYSKLLTVLQQHISALDENHQKSTSYSDSRLFRTMKCLQYLLRFIVRSRQLFLDLNAANINGGARDEFECQLAELLASLRQMMRHNSDGLLLIHGAFLKYLPTTIEDVMRVYDAVKLSQSLADILTTIPPCRLTKQKMMTINDIVHSRLFRRPDCRQILLPVIARQIRRLLETSEEVELCVKILSDILHLLSGKKKETSDDDSSQNGEENGGKVGSTHHDVTEIMLTLLRTIIQTNIAMDRENPLVGNLVAVMIAIFRQMSPDHYTLYIDHFPTKSDILDFLMEILLVFKDLVNRSVFPADWCDMILLQNSVFLKSLKYFSHTIRDMFSDKFDQQAWSNFFHCGIAFVTQPALQLEQFGGSKAARVRERYGDMRMSTAAEIRSMWFNLGSNKVQFVPSLVGAFLDMSLIPEPNLRHLTIPIFFDMMQCEFYSSKHTAESYGDTKRDSSQSKGNFHDFEQEMVAQLDMLIEGGKGDEAYKQLFKQVMLESCTKHSSLNVSGVKFVDVVTRLMEHLLEYRAIMRDDEQSPDMRMSCTVRLLEFYKEIDRKEMYIRYINKLCDLHLECENYIEAAHTLQLHTDLLSWSTEALSASHGKNNCRFVKQSTVCQTQRELKEALYCTIMDYFDKGKLWERSIAICKELALQYENETFDYDALSRLHHRLASFYEKILTQVRPTPEYFRVGYYGRGLPQFLQNQAFIYRGKEYERLSDFSQRIVNQWPTARLMETLEGPGVEVMQAEGCYIQINKVDPIINPTTSDRLHTKPISSQILSYYQFNDVSTFQYSRKFTPNNSTTNTSNEFANLWLERQTLTIPTTLPNILRWFPITKVETRTLTPLENAIETMKTANQSLKQIVEAYQHDPTLPLKVLSMKLTGMLDPAVMGGVANYERAFFTAEYLEGRPGDGEGVEELKGLVVQQVPLLGRGVAVHGQRVSREVQPLQEWLEQCWAERRQGVEAKYGGKICDFPTQPSSVTMRRQMSSRLSSSSLFASSPTTVGNSGGNSNSNVGSIAFTNRNSDSSSSVLSSSSPPIMIDFLSKHTVSLNSLPRSNSKTTALKEKRKSNSENNSNSAANNTVAANNSNSTQWYLNAGELASMDGVGSCGNMVPLFEELTPKRPLRSQVEREQRRRSSAANSLIISPNNRVSIDSQTTTDSSSLNTITSEEDSKNAENTNINANLNTNTSSSSAIGRTMPPPLPIKSSSVIVAAKSKELTEENDCGDYQTLRQSRELPQMTRAEPPVPPPKPPKK